MAWRAVTPYSSSDSRAFDSANVLWKHKVICHLFSTWECHPDPIPLLLLQKTMSRKTAEPLLSATQYNTAVGVWTQIIWVYKVYGFQRQHHDGPMPPKRGKTHKGKSQVLKRKLLLQATREIKTRGWTNAEKLAGLMSTHWRRGGHSQ